MEKINFCIGDMVAVKDSDVYKEMIIESIETIRGNIPDYQRIFARGKDGFSYFEGKTDWFVKIENHKR